MTEDDNQGAVSTGPQPEAEGTPLAKLSMPRLATGVQRTRLFGLLDDARRRAGIWIVAPAGAGKTTLVTSYISERKIPYLWYHIDGDDIDPATFFYYLGIAVQQMHPDREMHLPLLTPEYLPDISGFARRYFRSLFTLLSPGALLVLDDYQDLGESPILDEILRSAIGEIPQGFNMVVISRADPPAKLARHQATGALGVIDWSDLRLSLEETRSLAASHQLQDEELIELLHERSEGWITGLTLFLDQIRRKGISDWGTGTVALDSVFDFFATEFFNDLSGVTRDFLLKTALLSHMTPDLAEAVSENKNAGKILADLHRRHYFTNRHDLPEINYQYHDLFREFLLARLEASYSRAQYLKLVKRVVALLVDREREEEAVGLLLRAGDWDGVIPMFLAIAPQLLSQGRAQTLGAWLRCLPEERVNAIPWLLYWRGISQQFVDPFAAQAILEQAHDSFVAHEDMAGMMMSVSAIIDIAYIVRSGFVRALTWADVLQGYMNTRPSFPSPVMEGRVLTSLVAMLMFSRPQDPQLPQYAYRLQAVLEGEFDINHKIFMTGHLIYYQALIAGNREVADGLMAKIQPLLSSPRLTVINNIFWRHMCVLPLLLAGRAEDAREMTRPVMALVEEHNLRFMELISCVYEAHILSSIGDIDAATPFMERMPALLSTAQPMDLAWVHWSRCWYALVSGDIALSISQGLGAIKEFSEFLSPTCELEVRCLVAYDYCESGNLDDAQNQIAILKSHGYCKTPRMHFQISLIEAYLTWLRGDKSTCHSHLKVALEIGHLQRYFGNFFWFSKMMFRLCTEALRVGIEADYVRQLIRRHGMVPEETDIDLWPWPIKIFTMGQFRVEVDDRQQALEVTIQRKPLVLLEMLISLGGVDVKSDQLIGALWPEAEGNSAVSSLTTTISRLRKLIGDEALIVRNGRVSLDRQKCWVDVDALDRRFKEIESCEGKPSVVRAVAEGIFDLYQGAFLGNVEEDWPRGLRDRLRDRFRHFLECYIRVLADGGEQEKVEPLLSRLIEVDSGLDISFPQANVGHST